VPGQRETNRPAIPRRLAQRPVTGNPEATRRRRSRRRIRVTDRRREIFLPNR
jgi:hypothetical protein